MANEFPPIWFDTFLTPTNAAPIDREIGFIRRHMPLPHFRRILDVPCGIGRHAGPLSAMGYDVLGIDRSEGALAVARREHSTVEFLNGDMFDIADLGRTFDGVICLWQSFGYGTTDRNRQLLSDMRRVIRPGGRLLLDVYNADAAASLPSVSTERRGERVVVTRRSWTGRRLSVALEYSDGDGIDCHEWELYSPSELERLASDAELRLLISCAWFDEGTRPGPAHLRMQFLLERSEA